MREFLPETTRIASYRYSFPSGMTPRYLSYVLVSGGIVSHE